MNLIRRLRAHGRLLPFAAAALLVVVIATGALASRAPSLQDNQAPLDQDASEAPEADEQETPLTAQELARVVNRLAAAGIETDADTVSRLAVEHGLGGAVRLLSWASASGMSVDEIAAMRAGDADTASMGWGQIAQDLDVRPGIGNIMGGGHGRDNAPGQDEDSARPF